jgi:hypothetical protein
MTPAAPDHPESPLWRDPPPPVAVRSFGLTDRGKVGPSNEDHFLIAEVARTLWVRQTSLAQPDTDHLADGRTAAVLGTASDPRAACERLVAETNDRGGPRQHHGRRRPLRGGVGGRPRPGQGNRAAPPRRWCPAAGGIESSRGSQTRR